MPNHIDYEAKGWQDGIRGTVTTAATLHQLYPIGEEEKAEAYRCYIAGWKLGREERQQIFLELGEEEGS